MTVHKTHISWADSTWNPTSGCTKVSDGCRHCYAEAIMNRLWGGAFDRVALHPDRLAEVRSFTPLPDPEGPKPRRVFVNSVSDLMHDQIPDAFRHRVFDAAETNAEAIYIVLTKRAMTLRRYIGQRFAAGVPQNVWLGVSAEDARVRGRLDALRRLQDDVGPFTAVVSIEPLIGPPDGLDLGGIAWALIGGESDALGRARPMHPDWARRARDLARAVDAAIWFKQWGAWPNNPLYAAAPQRLHFDRVRHAIARGEAFATLAPHPRTGRPVLTGEKGGATLDGEGLRELPPAYAALRATLAPLPTLFSPRLR